MAAGLAAAVIAGAGERAHADGAGRGPQAPSAEAAPWAIELGERLELVPGTVGAAALTVRGKGRHSVARSGLLVDLEPSAKGLSVRQRRYQRADAAEAEAAEPSFSIPVRAEAAGSYALKVRVRFWVCAQRSCLPVDEQRLVIVEVVEPAAPVATEPPAVSPPVVSPPAKPGPGPRPGKRPGPGKRPAAGKPAAGNPPAR